MNATIKSQFRSSQLGLVSVTAYLGDGHDQVGGQERSPDHVVDPEPGGDVPDGSLRSGGGESEDRLDVQPLMGERANPEAVRPGRDAEGVVGAYRGERSEMLV